MTQHLAIAAGATESSTRALRACVQLARRMNTKKITLLQAIPEVVYPHARLERVTAECSDLRTRMHRAAERQLAELGQLVEHENIEIHSLVVDGAPAKILPNAALECGATTLVVGTTGYRGWFHRWFETSVAPSIVHASPLPTLVFNASESDRPADAALGTLSKIVIAADREPGALDAVRMGLNWASRSDRVPQVTVLVNERSKEQLIAPLRASYPELDVIGFRHRGNRTQRVLWEAAKMDAHLVVIASTQGGRHHRRYFDALSGVVTRMPSTPTLVVRANEVPLETVAIARPQLLVERRAMRASA